jgi:hypothetical protein
MKWLHEAWRNLQQEVGEQRRVIQQLRAQLDTARANDAATNRLRAEALKLKAQLLRDLKPEAIRQAKKGKPALLRLILRALPR